ncbi:MAG: 5-formyltetrahydrofolate cyclo-ligase [Alphaproteobacteria bacterium]
MPSDPTDDATVRAKAELRRTAMARRAAAAATAPDAGAALADRFRAVVPCPPGAAVSGFWPMGDEIDVRPLLKALHMCGHPVGLPVAGPRGTVLAFRRWTPETILVPGIFGTSEPPADAAGVEPDILLVPLLAFDRGGNRLGYGGGYYDRTLAALRARRPVVAIGVGFAAQCVSAVPHGPFDQPLDWIVTEEAALHVAAEKNR